MARDTTPKYVLHLDTADLAYVSPIIWRVKTNNTRIPGYGKPTTANIAKWVESFEQSTQSDGVNKHLGPQIINRAWVINQFTGETVAQWERN